MSPSTSHDRCACPFHHASDGASLDLGGGCDATANGRSSTRHRVARERPFGVVAVAIVTREKNISASRSRRATAETTGDGMTATTMRSTTREPFETVTRARDAMTWMRARGREVRERMRERCERARWDAFGDASDRTEGASEGGGRGRAGRSRDGGGREDDAREREAVTASWSEVGGKENRERCVCAREAMRARFETRVDVGEWSNAGTKRLTPAAARRRARSDARPRSAKKLASAQKRGEGRRRRLGRDYARGEGRMGANRRLWGMRQRRGRRGTVRFPSSETRAAEKGSDASGASVGAEAAVKTKDSVENGARARDLSPNAADSVERGEAERGERARRATTPTCKLRRM